MYLKGKSAEQVCETVKGQIGKPIVLVGLMGVGKSTVGSRLAKKLHLDFVDADEEIEKAARMSIAEIFETFGEEFFRDGERRVIARLIDDGPKVVATGGGAFMNDETRALIGEKAVSVWLNADIDLLVERVERRNTRPLLRDKDPAAVLRDLAAKRNPIYAQANVQVRSVRGPHGNTVNAIIEGLAEWLT